MRKEQNRKKEESKERRREEHMNSVCVCVRCLYIDISTEWTDISQTNRELPVSGFNEGRLESDFFSGQIFL